MYREFLVPAPAQDCHVRLRVLFTAQGHRVQVLDLLV